jgi:nitroreductase
MDILEAMRSRKSVRTYRSQEIPRDLLDALMSRFDKSQRLNDLRVRLALMRGDEVGPAMTGLVGSYGAIKNAPHWAIGISEDGVHYGENFGFRMEQFVLDCTLEKLGTCWVGGFFKVSKLDQLVPKAKGERIVCISPLGYPMNRRTAEVVMRSLGGLNSRKPLRERVFHEQWGVPAVEYLSSRKNLLELFELARWAPSASNRQPCHYLVDDDRIVIVVLTSLHREYPKLLTQGTGMSTNFQPIDAGIAMSHIYLAARALGIAGSWTLTFDEGALRARYQVPEEAIMMGVFNFFN